MALTYRWTGKTLTGMVRSGEMAAASREEVVMALRKEGVIPTVINEQQKAAFSLKALTQKKTKVKDKDLVVFTRQFAAMLTAGIPIVQALDILAKQVENKGFGETIQQIKSSVETGTTLADSLKKHPKVFDDLYVNMIAAGETGGVLDDVLIRLAVYIEKAMKLKRKIKGAMVYPAVVVTVAVLVVAVIMVFVIPVFAKVFTSMGATLPLPTQIVVGASNFIAGLGGLLILIGSIAGFFGFKQFRNTEGGRAATDRLFLRMPIVGELLRKVAIARFSRSLGTLITSGVPILDALEICAKTAGNKVVEYLIIHVKKEVSTGKTLADPLSKSAVFPPMPVQMISVGESTGALDQMLGKVADFYDDEVDNSVANLTSMLEPILIVFLGTTVGFIVVSLYLPIFKIGGVVTGAN
jgi:type IV pilus assembly protein PilC